MVRAFRLRRSLWGGVWGLWAGLAAFLGQPALGQNWQAAPQTLGGEPGQGFSLSLSWSAGVLEQDLWSGVGAELGYEGELFALRVGNPAYIRLYDVPPATARPPGLCAWLRCEVLGVDEEGDWTAMSQWVRDLRIGTPDSAFYLRGGPMRVSLGDGLLVERHLGSVDPDRRISSLFVRSRLPQHITLEALLGDLLAPQRLFGFRAQAAPFHWTQHPFWGTALWRRMQFAVELAGDFSAPDRWRSALDHRPLLAAALELQWPLLEGDAGVQLTPFVATSGMSGLSAAGDEKSQFGAGARLGARTQLRGSWFALRGQGSVGLDSPAHRPALFDTLYAIERHIAWAGASKPGAGLLQVAAPGGSHWQAQGELVMLDALRFGLRYSVDAAPGSATGEAFAEMIWGSLRAAFSGIRRHVSLDTPWRLQDPENLWAAEASWGFFGPFSLYSRILRLPRLRGGQAMVWEDVVIGVSADLRL